jgi:hypothetical protein
MSYILDALKKAERDRLREDPKELDDFASSNWDPYQQAPASKLPMALMLLCATAIAIALFIYSGLLSFEAPSDKLAQQTAPPVIQSPALQQPSSENIPPVKSLEAEVKEVPNLTITGHMYIDEGSASNRLFADGRTLRHGDKINADWTLVVIGMDSYEISSGQRREILSYR